MHTYTATSVYGGLVSAANFARVLGKKTSEEAFTSAAEEVKSAILEYLYDKKTGLFYKSVEIDESKGVISKIQPVIFQVYMEFLLSGSSGR